MRLIDADEALESLEDLCRRTGLVKTDTDVDYNQFSFDWIARYIEARPTAVTERKQEWISVQDRLPEVGEEVLVFAVGKSGDFSNVITITDRMIFRLFPSSEGVETWSSPWQYFMTNYEITHWMPLPEPPKE